MAKRETPIRIKTIGGYTFQNPHLLHDALTHPSVGGREFQRLEFLGDRVLGLVMAKWLYDLYPQEPEGILAKRFVQLVKRQALNEVALQLNLWNHLKFDQSLASPSSRIGADTCEAIIGAIYLDGGLEAAAQWIQKVWVISPLTPLTIDAKTTLQEHLQGQDPIQVPHYQLEAQVGPSHAPHFSVRLTIGNQTFLGQGASRRQAEQAAAEQALCHYGIRQQESFFGVR